MELDHIFKPEFTDGALGPVAIKGLHHIEGPQNLETGRVADLLEGPDEHGVYEAVIEARNPADGMVYQKWSTMFP